MALNLEPIYQDIFAKLKTRKKFIIRSIEKNLVTIEQDEEICGQKEPKVFEFKNQRKLFLFRMSLHSISTADISLKK